MGFMIRMDSNGTNDNIIKMNNWCELNHFMIPFLFYSISIWLNFILIKLIAQWNITNCLINTSTWWWWM